jgi:hypothetical protein
MRTNDENEIADSIDRLNPYTRTLDELKNDIIRIGSTAARLEGLE